MKTRDGLDALIDWSCMEYLAAYWGDENAIRTPARRAAALKAALLRRIEAGDRAREALKQVEFVMHKSTNDCYWSCPWCGKNREADHAPDCPRQIALGSQEVEP